ncbi:carbohydrate kinase family protein [Streptomyces sp. NPDC091281]|uniref:carbohydrate kinase family protein n=1 Tax=Streptomyces sp. NPDC091281 TaxID=3365985 RepID=UPI00382CD644
MPRTFDLLVIGDANPDVIIGPVTAPLDFGQREQLVDHGVMTLGGSAAITACGAARLGLGVAFAGRVGDDEAGRYVRDRLAARGVDVDALHLDPALSTPLTVSVTRGEGRAIVTAAGTLPRIAATDVPAELLAAARHVHSASFFLMPALAAGLAGLFRAARAAGATTSLDTNDDPAGQWASPALTEVLAETDLLLPNAQEARRLAGVPEEAGLAGTARLLTRRGPAVAVKDGAAGALYDDGTTAVHRAAQPVADVRDTVGAGDSFDAGFIAARLRGLPPEEALAVAGACGALSTHGFGGTDAQPTWAEALATLPNTGAVSS